MIKKLYHVSNTPNLKILEPRISTHGKAYVYATPYLELALLFGSKKSYGDFDGIYGINKQGKPYFYEAYLGAFKRRFEDETCYIYELKSDTFKAGETSFNAEVVSEQPVEILNCTEVKDLYKYLIKVIGEGNIEFKEYSVDENYQKMIKNHIKNRLLLFNILKKKDSEIYRFCKQKFPDLVDNLEMSSEQ